MFEGHRGQYWKCVVRARSQAGSYIVSYTLLWVYCFSSSWRHWTRTSQLPGDIEIHTLRWKLLWHSCTWHLKLAISSFVERTVAPFVVKSTFQAAAPRLFLPSRSLNIAAYLTTLSRPRLAATDYSLTVFWAASAFRTILTPSRY